MTDYDENIEYVLGVSDERKRILAILEEEGQVGHAILAKEDCNADCYKCDISGSTTINTVARIRAKILD